MAVSHHLSRSCQEFPKVPFWVLCFLFCISATYLVLSPLHVLCLPTILSCMIVAMASALINPAVVWKKTSVLSMPGLATGVPHLTPLSLHTCSYQASTVDLEMRQVHPCPCQAVLFPWWGRLLILVFGSQALPDHLSNVIRRVKFKAFLLKHLARRPGSADLVKRLYCCLVHPVFEYAAPVWDACSQRDTITIERFQLSIARPILHVHRRQMHNIDVLATTGWPTLAWRRRHQKLSLLWDLLHGGGPPFLCSQVPSPVSSRCSYSFRNPLTLSLPSCRTSRRLKSFLPSSVALFNSLPISVVCCSSKRSILQAVDEFFLPDNFSYGLLWVSTFLSHLLPQRKAFTLASDYLAILIKYMYLWMYVCMYVWMHVCMYYWRMRRKSC